MDRVYASLGLTGVSQCGYFQILFRVDFDRASAVLKIESALTRELLFGFALSMFTYAGAFFFSFPLRKCYVV